MDRPSNSSISRFDFRNRRQRRHDIIRSRYAAMPSQSPVPLVDLQVPEPPPARTPNIRFGEEAGQSTLLRHRLRSARDSQRTETVQETVDELDRDIASSLTNTSGLSQTLPVPNFDNEHSGLLDGPDGRRHKRRKLDSDPLDKHPKINYGYHGQVAPGRLNMMISYCDGGVLHHDDKTYASENILKNDKSVYCSRKGKVSLMLAHWHEVPFTCTKIVIKTPDSGFPSPVQEGMVFVSMNAEELRESSGGFQMESCPHTHSRSPPPPESSRHRTRLRLTNGAWQLDPHESPRSASSPHILDPSEQFNFESFLQEDFPNWNHEQANYAEPRDLMPPLARIPGRRTSTLIARSAYSENISTTCENPSDDEEDPTAEPILEDRRRRGQQAETDSEDEENDLQYSSSNRSARQRFHPRNIEWVESRVPSSRLAADDRPKPPGPDVAYSKFFIERKKHVVSVKFDPPVSGKYILLKLWSPQGRDSLDLQSVCVYGFAGPRFFPSIVTR